VATTHHNYIKLVLIKHRRALHKLSQKAEHSTPPPPWALIACAVCMSGPLGSRREN